MFGREINIPLTLLHEPLPSTPPSHIEYIGKLQDNINKAYDIVRGHMKTQQKRQKVNYDLKQSGKPYKENDLVWLFTPRKKKGLSPKLQKIWVGPYRIVKKLSDANYMIQLEGSLAKRIVHYNRLKIYVTPHPDRTLVKKPIISPPPRPLSSGEGSETEDMSNDESGNEEVCSISNPKPHHLYPADVGDFLLGDLEIMSFIKLNILSWTENPVL